MQQPHPCESYRAVAAQTATPGQLVLMLYEGAIRHLERARVGFTCDDPLEFHRTINNNLQRAQAIINELNDILNMREGGRFAETMRSLYDYMDRRLHESNQRKTEDGILEVIQRLASLRNAWSEMLGQQPVETGDNTPFRLSAAA